MAVPTENWGTIHASVYSQAASVVRRAAATMRAHGALRYQCPVTGSLVLITDDATLAGLARPRARVRCVDCGEMHLLTRDADNCDPAIIVPAPATP
jgi:hypothetical protein